MANEIIVSKDELYDAVWAALEEQLEENYLHLDLNNSKQNEIFVNMVSQVTETIAKELLYES